MADIILFLQLLNYIAEDHHPDRTPPSVQLGGEIQDTGFVVPPDLLPPNGTLSNGFSILFYFKPQGSDEDNM